jgi:hypothetical protein
LAEWHLCRMPSGRLFRGGMPGGRSPTRVTPRKRPRNSCWRDLWRMSEAGVVRRPSVKARMRALAVVEVPIATDQSARRADAVAGAAIDLFVFDRAPEPLDKDVVAPRPLAVHAPLPSTPPCRPRPLAVMLIAMALSSSRPVTSAPVNWLPWSVLKISGVPRRASASSTASRQNATCIAIDTRHDRTRRLNQSTTAASRQSRVPLGCR